MTSRSPGISLVEQVGLLWPASLPGTTTVAGVHCLTLCELHGVQLGDLFLCTPAAMDLARLRKHACFLFVHALGRQFSTAKYSCTFLAC